MALTTTASVLGAPKNYVLSPEVKRYTLRDVGFRETRNGNFQLDQPLNGESPYAAGFKLKMTVAKDLQKFKMSVTDDSGLHPLNIFKAPDKTGAIIEQFNFVIQNLIDRQVIAEK
ncbi:hypothetical protein FC83_GL002505 [Agrilactobacillus composti DSM 18527 = JCM 14202]|uniref:Cysteine desulfurase n=1 Tax=Agrilactobacillus composti DSM 18527 = JCM 14202 TaxID=1423734 RepID=X0PDJ1_9LACO|nr:DUF1831 domain-containing protein [Agrilactobacillus composti]KRM36631.1 hypothetical protein FC83_GL002505 [Agrilactobacillus composti DSM 18527 = JCM 14202]GAF39033.1 hypothetical protein JCM14202_870 [Agrilactobacillus composti DSM 18527 = JCM 14202]